MCDRHYRRVLDHGHAGTVRREGQHPEYRNWWWLKAHGKLCLEWTADFDLFATSIGERPSARHWLERQDETQPFGPENFFWREPMLTEKHSFTTTEGRRAYTQALSVAQPGRFIGQALKAYGLTTEDYESMLAAQGGVCAACGHLETERDSRNGQAKLFVVDHDHQSGAVRGLLCAGCNKAVGFANDDPDRLEKIAAYLRRTADLPAREGFLTQGSCASPGCRGGVYAKGFCNKHYWQERRGGDPSLDGPKVCKECGTSLSDKISTAKFCSHGCRMAWHRKSGAYTSEAVLKSRGACTIEGCGKAVHANGYCKAHAARHWKYGDATFVPQKAVTLECSQPDCNKPVVARGLCSSHYYANRKAGKLIPADTP